MKMYCLSFTDRGEKLAEKLTDDFGAYSDRCNRPLSLKAWTEKAFAEADTVVFIGACGIAVRAIAPYVVSKVTDPAVIVIDECGDFVISLLSGHLGGANDMARLIADAIGSVPVITTATDRNDVFAVDEWSKRQHAEVLEPNKIVLVSSKILDGKDIKVRTDLDMEGKEPDHVVMSDDDPDIEFGYIEKDRKPLHIVPVIIHLGIGCRRGTSQIDIESAFADFKKETGLIQRSVVKCASIDLKANEQGLKEFCEFHGWAFDTFSAETGGGIKSS